MFFGKDGGLAYWAKYQGKQRINLKLPVLLYFHPKKKKIK